LIFFFSTANIQLKLRVCEKSSNPRPKNFIRNIKHLSTYLHLPLSLMVTQAWEIPNGAQRFTELSQNILLVRDSVKPFMTCSAVAIVLRTILRG